MDTEKAEMNALERFLLWFLVPVVFGIVLVMVLMTLFGVDVKQEARNLGNRIPIIEKWVPDKPAPSDGEPATQPLTEKASASLKEKEKQIADLTAKLKEQTADAGQFQASYLKKDQELKDLQVKYDKLQEDLKKMESSNEAYDQAVSETSKVYAGMSPGKAAPILEAMTTAEQVLILSGMKAEDQTRILEKMTPAKAADVSVLLKDQVPARDRELLALQERVKKLSTTTAGTSFTMSDLGKTVAGMNAKQASALLLEMYKTSPAKVIGVLKAADSTARSSILDAMTAANAQKAAEISTKLTP
ncbi:MotE family protein [Gorillibacterium sp. sgz500922]|uniref:MotE family protein n=1 Tax=Gorillibacterium sp. sgz500922 TaxID=3446694 RepID=UPI003F667893